MSGTATAVHMCGRYSIGRGEGLGHVHAHANKAYKDAPAETGKALHPRCSISVSVQPTRSSRVKRVTCTWADGERSSGAAWPGAAHDEAGAAGEHINRCRWFPTAPNEARFHAPSCACMLCACTLDATHPAETCWLRLACSLALEEARSSGMLALGHASKRPEVA